MSALPQPSAEALAHSEQLITLIRAEIEATGGSISFARYMQLALYAPGLGYYSGGAQKFGMAGDFVTAPEISPLFAHTLARQVTEILQATNGNILELGAGTGQLALELLLELQRLGRVPERYLILEVSAQLRAMQRALLQQSLPPALMKCVEWLDSLPPAFEGVVLANEVLDALPVHLVQTKDVGGPHVLDEIKVEWQSGQFVWASRPLMESRVRELAERQDLPMEYRTEICTAAEGLIASLATMLKHGVLLFIDYGFPQHEYYHPQRSQGTLMCHYRHHAHDDPFFHPGLQDITAHVDFSLIAETAVGHKLQLLGYCSQAQFLINCGITELLANVSPHDMAAYAPLAAQAQKLLSPAEMGELFKVIALGKGMTIPLQGFVLGDKGHVL
jgi:SAM-dependent MidA family methyltransferase